MVRSGFLLGVVAAVALAGAAGEARSQAGPSFLPPAPTSFAADRPAELPGLAPSPAAPESAPSSPPPAAPGPELFPGPPPAPPLAPLGVGPWVLTVDAALVKPLAQGQTSPTIFTPGDPIFFKLPFAPLNWTVMPRFELSRPFDGGRSDFRISYRFLFTDGSGSLPGFDPTGAPGALHSRVALHVWDFDYWCGEFGRLPPGELSPWRWCVGWRLVESEFATSAVGPALTDRANSTYFAGGPHLGLEWRKPIGGPSGVCFYARADAAGMWGPRHLSFESAQLAGGAFQSTSFLPPTATPTTAGVFGTQAGLSWTPGGDQGPVRLTAGYVYERWWNLAAPTDSQIGLVIQGLFIRARFAF